MPRPTHDSNHAAGSEHAGGDQRRRVLDAADVLLAALEEARGCYELRHMQGDLAELRDIVTRMRGTVERRRDIAQFWM